jgi:hypothetical protein
MMKNAVKAVKAFFENIKGYTFEQLTGTSSDD